MAFQLLGHDEQLARVARVLACIRKHKGPSLAISIAAIAERTDVPYRDVQEITKYLVEERFEPIGTLWSKPYGYYIVTDEHDLARNAWQVLSRGVSNIRHGRAYLTPALAGPIAGQLDLFVVNIAPFLAQLEERVAAHRRSQG
ncbi:MAG: hypothetical protein ACXW28_07130 [Thermoanaerobaculia bacterium]